MVNLPAGGPGPGMDGMECDVYRPTQHSITKSRVSLAQVTSLGRSSARTTSQRMAAVCGVNEPVIIFATVALGRERSSSMGGSPECPSRSDMARRTNSPEPNTLLINIIKN